MPVLSRTQQNHIFQAAALVGVPHAAFSWSTKRQSYRGDVEILRHTPTGSHFSFSLSGGRFWLEWWPNYTDGETLVHVERWEQAVAVATKWLVQVKKDDDAPDLWAEVRRTRLDIEPESEPELLQPFSDSELKLLGEGLNHICEYVISTQPLDPPSQEAVRARFAYLFDAAKRGVRKIDWRNIFVGEIVGMIRDGLLNPSFYQAVMAHTATALNAIFHFAARLPS